MSPFPPAPSVARTVTLLLAVAAAGTLACSSSNNSGASDAGASGGSGGAMTTGGSGGGAAGMGGSGGSGGGAAGMGGSGGSGGGAAGMGGSGGPSGSGGGVVVDAGSADAPAAADGPATGGPFALTSAAFQNNGVIDPKYRCGTANLSPPLGWTPGPAGTQSYAVTLNHNAALHWLLWDIAPTTTSLPEAVARMASPPVPAGAKQNMTSTDKATWYGYTGPCPGGTTTGGSFTDYPFTVYALKVATLAGVTPQSSSAQIKAAIDAATLAKTTLTAMAGGGK